jgi:hypothetical protein
MMTPAVTAIAVDHVEGLGVDPEVGVHEAEDLAPGRGRPAVAGAGDPPPLDVGDSAAPFAGDLGGPVR